MEGILFQVLRDISFAIQMPCNFNLVAILDSTQNSIRGGDELSDEGGIGRIRVASYLDQGLNSIDNVLGEVTKEGIIHKVLILAILVFHYFLLVLMGLFVCL